MNYLFIGAHTDDIELSCGGFIRKLLERECQVRCYTFSYINRLSLLQEHSKSMERLGVKNFVVNNYQNRTFSYYRQQILDELIMYKEAYQPDVVVSHHPSDIHQDHKVVAEETLRAFKFTDILQYIGPWNNIVKPNYYVPLTRNQVDIKVEALSQYDSQRHKPYMDEDMIRTNSRYHANESPFYHYCEAFTAEKIYFTD